MVSLILGSIAVFDMGVFPRTWDFMHGASTTAFFVGITLALLFIDMVAIACFADDMGIAEYHCCCPLGCPSASSRAVERWCYRTVACLLAMIIVDDSLWDYVVGETDLIGT